MSAATFDNAAAFSGQPFKSRAVVALVLCVLSDGIVFPNRVSASGRSTTTSPGHVDPVMPDEIKLVPKVSAAIKRERALCPWQC